MIWLLGLSRVELVWICWFAGNFAGFCIGLRVGISRVGRWYVREQEAHDRRVLRQRSAKRW